MVRYLWKATLPPSRRTRRQRAQPGNSRVRHVLGIEADQLPVGVQRVPAAKVV